MTAFDIIAGGREDNGRARIAWLMSALRGISAALDRGLEHRAAVRALQGMSDHMLKDIGIARADIHRRVRGLD